MTKEQQKINEQLAKDFESAKMMGSLMNGKTDNDDIIISSKIDVTKILNTNVKVYMNDEIIWYLQDFKISNNKIKMSEACTVEGLDKIIKNYNKNVNITFKSGNNEITLFGRITSYEVVEHDIYDLKYIIDIE